MKFLTIEQIREHLRYDSDEFDSLLTTYGEAAEEAVLNYVNNDLPKDGEGTTIYPPAFTQAALILVGMFDNFRNGEKEMLSDGNYLTPPVRSLLVNYRCFNAL